MASPTGFFVNPVLSGVAAAYAPPQFVAPQIFPIVPAVKQKGEVFNLDPNRLMQRVLNTKRGPAGLYPIQDFESPTTTEYFCADHALQGLVADEYRLNADPEAMPALPTIQSLVNSIALEREKNLVTLLGTLSQTSSPSTKWDNSAGSIITDVKAQKKTIRDAIGRNPNTLVLSSDVLDKVTETPDYKDRVKAVLTPEQQRALGPGRVLAAALDIESVIIADVFENTAAQGQAASMTSVWGETVLLAFVDNPRSVNVAGSQALGMHVVWNDTASGVYAGFSVAEEEIKNRKAQGIYVNHYYDQFLLNTGAGYWFTNVLT